MKRARRDPEDLIITLPTTLSLASMFRFYCPGGKVEFCRNLFELEHYKLFTDDHGEPVFLNLRPTSVMDVREICVGDRLALRQ